MRTSCLSLVLAYLLVLGCKPQEAIIVAADAQPVMVKDGFSFTEGPAVAANGDVYFTDQPNNRIYRWDADTGEVELYMENAGRANGLYFDQKGNLLACADENFQLWQIDDNKNVKVLVEGFDQKDFNGPNDLWVDKNGGIYFTDPYYQRDYWSRTSPEMDRQRVYYRHPDGKVQVVADHFVKPNGIVGTKDGKTLYIADIGDKKTYRYHIQKDGRLGEPSLFASMGSDGMTIDEHGNLYLTGDGVTVFSPKGVQIGHIPVAKNWTANVTFGGKDRKTLFITASSAVFTVQMNVKGAR